MKYTSMVQDFVRPRGLSSLVHHRQTPNNKYDRPDSTRKYDLKKSYIIEDKPASTLISNQTEISHLMSLRCNAKTNISRRQLEPYNGLRNPNSQYRQKRGYGLVDERKAQPAARREGNKPFMTIDLERSYHPKPQLVQTQNYLQSMPSCHKSSYSQKSRLQNPLQTKTINIIGNIDKVQQKIRNALQNK